MKRTSEWLAPGGVLVYLIPDYRISRSVAAFLAARFERISVMRFPGSHYNAFRQVTILAVKRETPVIDKETMNRILAYADGSAPALTIGEREYEIPPLDEKAPFRFHLADAAPEDLAAEARASGAWDLRELADALDPPRPTDIRPLLPLKRGHVAMLLAAGCLGNAVLEKNEKDNRRVVVKGQLTKKSLDRTTAADEEAGATRTLETFTATIETLDLATGEIAHIENEENLRRWFQEWKEPLLSHLARTSRPLHEGDLGPYASVLDSLSRFRRLPGRRETGLFPAQKHVAAAATKFLTRGGKSVVLQATMGTGKTTMAVAVASLFSNGGCLLEGTAPSNPTKGADSWAYSSPSLSASGRK